MDSQTRLSGSYTWTINEFSQLTREKYYSDVFTVGGCKWRILIYPKGNVTDYLAVYLDVPDAANLPTGWSREAEFVLTVIDQKHLSSSISKDAVHTFKESQAVWGYTWFTPLSNLCLSRRGLIVNDTMIIKADVRVLSVVIRSATETSFFESFFVEQENPVAINTKEGPSTKSVSSSKANDLMSDPPPSLEEVEEAKMSLEEILSGSGPSLLNTKDRLAAALSTLSRAEVGLSADQRRSVEAFWDDFDDFIRGLVSQRDPSELKLLILANEKDRVISDLKKNREAILLNKRLLEAITEEGQEIRKRMEEISSRMEKVISECDDLMARSKELETRYIDQKRKLEEAEEKKKFSEQRMSRAKDAWSSLKAQFLVMPRFRKA